jgi:hypothetical protein
VDTLLPLLAFGFGTLLVTAVAWATLSKRSATLDQRLREVGLPERRLEGGADPQQIAAFLKRVGERVPRSAGELSKLQLRLVQAGYRRGDALAIFLGIRFAVAIAVFALLSTPVLVRPNIGLALVGAALG